MNDEEFDANGFTIQALKFTRWVILAKDGRRLTVSSSFDSFEWRCKLQIKKVVLISGKSLKPELYILFSKQNLLPCYYLQNVDEDVYDYL